MSYISTSFFVVMLFTFVCASIPLNHFVNSQTLTSSFQTRKYNTKEGLDDHTIIQDGVCLQIIDVNETSNNNIVSCLSSYFLMNNKCVLCSSKYTHCTNCDKLQCTQCERGFTFLEGRTCVNKSCVDGEIVDENGQCEVPRGNCGGGVMVNWRCVYCDQNYFYYPSDGSCRSINNQLNCEQSLRGVCTRCKSGYFMDNGVCVSCDQNCQTCKFSSKNCSSCPSGFVLNNNLDGTKKCSTPIAANPECLEFNDDSPICRVCRDGFYFKDKKCVKCPDGCELCNSKCLTCNSSYYLTITGMCKPKSDMEDVCNGVINSYGCDKCKPGFYTFNKECFKCDTGCIVCKTGLSCIQCDENRILKEGKCHLAEGVPGCTSVSNSMCATCKFWSHPSDNGLSCENAPVWWVFFVLFLVVLGVIGLLVLIGFVLWKLHKTIETQKVEENLTLFEMKRSNIQFITLKNGICVSTNEINFNMETNGIPVNKESRQILCIGNDNEYTINVQLTSDNSEKKYLLRMEPAIVTLRKGVACEFEIYITPNFTCNISSVAKIVSKSLENGDENITDITINAITESSIRIDPDELIEEEIIGASNFGIVYQGKLSNKYVVAIKKMKHSTDEEGTQTEFEQEVELLEKCKNQYLPKFYGAVFVTTKISFVVEFAEYLSLQDVMENYSPKDVGLPLRIKMMSDAANGLLYLHDHEVLHGDLKPTNILVFSLNMKETVNAKLTGFGSMRNVKLLQQNLAMTKEVDSPKYFPPEILMQGKYTKASDVFSLSIVMYECFGWKEAYPKEDFKFQWKIAEFVTGGKRLKNVEKIPVRHFILITNCWC
ncbi:protein serine/threonine kinase, putative, partial [Entamoeba invadens IP1]